MEFTCLKQEDLSCVQSCSKESWIECPPTWVLFGRGVKRLKGKLIQLFPILRFRGCLGSASPSSELVLHLWLMPFFCIIVSQVSCPYWISIFGIIFPKCISWCFSKWNFTLFSGHVRNLLRFLCIISDFTAIQSSLFNILRRYYLYAILIIYIIKEVINVWTKLILTSRWQFFPVGYFEIFITYF